MEMNDGNSTMSLFLFPLYFLLSSTRRVPRSAMFFMKIKLCKTKIRVRSGVSVWLRLAIWPGVSKITYSVTTKPDQNATSGL